MGYRPNVDDENPNDNDLQVADESVTDPLNLLIERETSTRFGRQFEAPIQSLPERQRRVIQLYYLDGLTMEEVGKVLGVTESRASQIHGEAISKIKEGMQRQTR